MKIPKMFFGKYKDVKSNVKKLITKLKNGEDLNKYFNNDYIDTNNNKSPIVIMGPNSNIGNDEVFNIYVLIREIYINDNLNNILEEKIFNHLILSDWGTLSLLGFSENYLWYEVKDNTKDYNNRDKRINDRIIPLLRSVYKYWDIYVNEGKRFSYGGIENRYIWENILIIYWIFSEFNIPKKSLNSLMSPPWPPLEPKDPDIPPGGLKEIFEKYKEELKGVLD